MTKVLETQGFDCGCSIFLMEKININSGKI